MAHASLPERQALVTASSNLYPSQSDWNRVRPHIKRLYVDEDKTLEEVMIIMARDHGHRATMKMYKSRIRRWGLYKNTKEAEAWALLRLNAQREAAGKRSAFRVRGRNSTIDDVLRYFKRKGIVNPRVDAHPQQAPQAIEFWTPSPSPTPEFPSATRPKNTDRHRHRRAAVPQLHGVGTRVPSYKDMLESIEGADDTHNYPNADQIRQLLFSNPEIQSFEIPHSPLPPGSLIIPEKLFASIKAYYGGAHDNGLFQNYENDGLVDTNETIVADTLGQFNNLFAAGADLLVSNSFVEGRRCLSKASGLLNNLLRYQHPRTMECILDMLVILNQNGHGEIATLFRHLMSGIARLLFAEEHPWRQMFSEIGHLDNSHSEVILAEAWRCICDTLAGSFGQFDRTTVAYYTHYIRRVYRADGTPQIHNLLIQGQKELGQYDVALLDIKNAYGNILSSQGRTAEAITLMEEALIGYKKIGYHWMIFASLYLISCCRYDLGHKYEAESKLREAIKVSELSHTKFDSTILRLKGKLEQWLREWGRVSEAEAVKAELDERLGPDDIDLEEGKTVQDS